MCSWVATPAGVSPSVSEHRGGSQGTSEGVSVGFERRIPPPQGASPRFLWEQCLEVDREQPNQSDDCGGRRARREKQSPKRDQRPPSRWLGGPVTNEVTAASRTKLS